MHDLTASTPARCCACGATVADHPHSCSELARWVLKVWRKKLIRDRVEARR